MHASRLVGLCTVVMLAAFAACAPGTTNEGCSSDSECASGRICEDGACVGGPSGASSSGGGGSSSGGGSGPISTGPFCDQEFPSDHPGGQRLSGSLPTLSGAAVGRGTVTNADTRIPIQATVRCATSAFSVTDASMDHYGQKFVARVTNTSTRDVCNAEPDNVEFTNANGDVVASTPFVFLVGISGEQTDGFFFDESCLAPGTTGYLHAQLNAADPTIRGVVMEFTSEDAAWDAPESNVVPVSYEVVDGDVILTVRNDGTVNANITGQNSVFLVDEMGVPLRHGYFGAPARQTLPPGESTTLTHDILFPGEVTRVVPAILFWDDD